MRPFEMERWQSIHENYVDYNLAESGVHPLTVRELLETAEADPAALLDTPLSYGQSNGTEELRAAIAALYPDATEAHVAVTNGSAESNLVALWELVRPGDEVAIVLPTYMQTYGIAEAFGARIRAIHLHEDRGWQPDPDEIARAVTDRTRVLVVTNPNNPTGVALTAEARRALVQAAAEVGAWILADEVYAGAELEGERTPSFWGDYDRVVATGSLSKAYGLTGLRIGWTVAPKELTDRLWARTDYTTISTGLLTDRLAALALREPTRSRLMERTRTFLTARLDQLTAWLDETGGFTYHRPDAGAICYARYDLPVESGALAERLRAEESVLVVPGSHFDMGPYLRLGYGIPEADLAAALERVARVARQIMDQAGQPG